MANIGTSVVPLLTYILLETRIKEVHSTSSDKDVVLWIDFIQKYYSGRDIGDAIVFGIIMFQGVLMENSSYFRECL